MNERQRMQYLEAMGIDTFVPRLLLPHCRAPRACMLPEANNDADPLPAPMPPLAEGSARGLLAKLAPAAVPRAGAAEPQASADTAARVEQARFSLCLWRASDTLLVIDAHRPQEALPTHALLHNILQATALLPAGLPAAEILNWPLAGAVQRDCSWQAAREFVNSFVESRLVARPAKCLLLMGDDAVRVVLGEQPTAQAPPCRQLPEVFDALAIALPSLAELLHQPALKRPLWLALKDLHRQLV